MGNDISLRRLEEQYPGQTLVTLTGISSGIRSPSSRAKKMFKSFDLQYQSLTSSLGCDSNVERKLVVDNGVTGGPLAFLIWGRLCRSRISGSQRHPLLS